MVIQPIYNILFLPDVTYHFKRVFLLKMHPSSLKSAVSCFLLS